MELRRRHGNGRMRYHTQSSPILVSILLTVLSCLQLPHEVAGNASDYLLSGQYKPTTNIDHIIELTELIEAIESNTNDLDEAEKFYKQETEGNLISLEQISNSNDINYSYSNPSHYLDQSVNPLHGVTMYALWRSTHGNGKDGADVSRESMKFFSQPIDFYPHTIIMAEFDKSSGYNADVTAQTIRVTSMWMATVQSLYNGVDVCKKKPDGTDDPNWRNPIDMAAAFWIGTQEEVTTLGGGSLYAWTRDIGSKFTGQPDANAKIVEGLNTLQTLLQNCLLPSVPASDRDTNAQKMRVIADDIVRWMTVPMTQSLIWHSTDLGDANKRDFVVLYGLMTLPQIIVCDDKAFSDLYDAYVVNVKNEVDSDALLSAKKQLESRYTCLGIDCSMVGSASFLSGDVCKDSELNIHGYIGSSQELNEVATVDLDVRTIGTLVEMNANTAAHDIYHWGRFSKSGLDGGYYPLQKYATGTAHPSNTVAAAFVSHFGQTHPSDNIVDNAINGTGAFQSELSSTRRVIAEASMVTVLLHIYAIDSMYEAIDKCSIEPWDRAVAALTGWAEGTDNAKGLLFMSIGRYLCSRAATCEVANAASPDHGQDAKVNKLIMLEFKSGRDAINEGLCAEAKGHITKIETLILTELVDATAFFAQQVVANPSNSDNQADLYAIAWTLIPLITDTNAQQTIRNNVGLNVNTLSQQMVDQVLSALKTVVTEANIDCQLLDSAICGSESLTPQTASDVSSALDSGVSSQALLSYVPSTNVDSIIQLTSDIESIQQQSNKDASYKIYDKDGAVSLKQIATNQYFSSSSRKHNPLYSQYMYSLWKSADGGNAVGNPQDKEFDDEPVEFFGNSIVEDEYNKPSGYDPELTSETMRVVIMWMATVQSIYEGVQFCSETTVTSNPDRVNPIDKAAALWVGNAPFILTTFGGSLVAWTNRMHDKFGAPSFNANNRILDNLSQLKSDLDLCLQTSTSAEEKEQIIGRMWSVSKDTTTAMTVPLVQNLLYSLAIEANQDSIPGTQGEDALVLYSLMTLPQLWVCDEDGFKRLYKNIVSEKASLDSNLVKDAVSTLQNNYACLGISCDQVGNLKSPELLLQGSPSCQASTQLKIAGYDGISAQTMKVAQVDIDIRSIGMLLEIESYDAAASVYKYGGIFKDSDQGYNSIQSLASSPAKSSKGTDLKEQYSATAATQILDEALNENSFMMKDTTSIQRKVLAEATIVAITLHIYAIDSLFKAVELCDVDASTAATSWDNAVAALVGWMEGPEDGGSSNNGVLFYNIAQYLCDEADKCNMNNDSEVNRLMIRRLKEGKQHLNSRECVAADTSAIEVEKLLQTVLADINAYFAEQIAADKLNTEALAEGYIFAKALAPIMQSVDADASTVILQNLGDFPTVDPIKDGIATVLAALNTFVTKEGIDCKLLTTPICFNAANTVPIEPDNNGFLPGTGTNVNSPSENPNVASGLLGNAYTNTTNVDHIIKLTDRITMIANAGTSDVARAYYTQYEDGISLQTLSTGLLWEDISETNPLYVLYMYGFWNSEMGESDGDGYSNKMFDDNPLLPFGDTIVTDELEKESGFDAKLSAETILLTNMWMAMTNYLYGAVESCRDGSIRNQDYNDIDIAAALWFGSQTDPNSTTESTLFAWAKRAQSEFIGFSTGVNDEMIRMLSSLQKSYTSCKTADSERRNIAITMKTDVDHLIQIMIVPLMQNFIQILASMSGIGNQVQNDRSNYLVLYSLMLLPPISICDESTFDLLWDQLIGSKPQSYTSNTFVDILKTVQDRYQCLGISCDLVGRSSLNGGVGWPECDDNAVNRLELAGYKPATEGSQNWSLIDLDISTILSFIVMEATPLANDIYNNGRNVDDADSKMYVSIDSISTPSTIDVQNIWQSYESESSINGYSPSSVTKNAIKGTAEFESTAPLKKSAAASLALATIDMHIAILDNMYQAQNACAAKQAQQTSMYWDRAAAVTIGWSEGPIDGGSDTDGHLLFQIAQELCDRFDSCEENGNSKINTLLIDEFRNGLQYAKTFQCDRLKTSTGTIETLLQAILVDNLAFHTQFAESDWDEVHCLLAYISANAIVPFVRAVDADSANTIEAKIRVTSSPAKCFVEDRDAIYSSLKNFVAASAIDCNLLGSQVCGLAAGTNPIDSVQNSVYTSNNSGHATANGEYVPDVNVENLSKLKTVIQGICSAVDGNEAKKFYEDEDTIGVSIKSMSTFGKYVMADELLFNQYVYALYDDVDKTDGSFVFDGEPASEYAHTIVSDAFDGNFISIGCTAVKILHVWMWTVHKTYEALKQCDIEIPENYGAIDEAAALWEGGMLFDLAETLGPKFGHDEMNGMTYLNRQIIDRFNSAQSYFQDNVNSCQSKNALGGLRIIIKEIVSYMTAVLIQHLIDAMVDYPDSRPENIEEDMVELASFAVLPLIMTCGHEMVYDDLYNKLSTRNFDKSDIPSVTDAIHSHLNCLGLSCDDIGKHTSGYGISWYPECSDNLDIVGYVPINPTPTNMIAKLDLDAVAIDQMMQLEKYKIATDIYMNGHNYYDYEKEDIGFVSIYDMTQSATIGYTSFRQYTLYGGYFTRKGLGNSPGEFAHNIFVDATTPNGRFATATAEQRRSVVEITISSFVSYFSSLEALYYAAYSCSTNKDSAAKAYDGGVALLIGSVEGTEKGGNADEEGRFFYNLAKMACSYFDDCVEGGDAEINKLMLNTLTSGQTSLKNSDCSGVSEAVNKFASQTVVPLMQSLLTFAETIDNEPDGEVASMSIAPIVSGFDQTLSDKIVSTMAYGADNDDSVKKNDVYNAINTVLANANFEDIACDVIPSLCSSDGGTSTLGNITPDKPEPIKPEEPTPISGGLYISTTYIGDKSAIALDVKEIEERLQVQDIDRATFIYEEGMNSKIYDVNGMPTSKERSIQDFSLNSGRVMLRDPTYNLFINGLSDDFNEFYGKPVVDYADSYVSTLLYSASKNAGDAMVAIPIWMEVAHSLHSAYEACKTSVLSEDRSMDGRDLVEAQVAARFIDEAAAYWIGDGQSTGSSDRGHLLYALSETISEEYGESASSQSSMNTRIIDLLQQAKNHVAISRSCTTSSDSHLKLRSIIEEMIPIMAVPLLRSLLHAMKRDDIERVQMFAVAVLPLFAKCNPATYLELKNDLIDNTLLSTQKNYVYSKLVTLYDCLGLSCDLIGNLSGDGFAYQCEDSSKVKSLAGYSYVADGDVISSAAKIDIEIRLMEIYINNGVVHFPDDVEALFGLAYERYRFGNGSLRGEGSISRLAKDVRRDIVPSFPQFRRYFKSDENYADNIIVDAFEKASIFNGADADYRKRVILFTSKYMVLHMAILQNLYSAINSCKEGNVIQGVTNLDTAAAYYTGSLEGTEDGGSFEGSLSFFLARRMCIYFDTCSQSDNAMINERVISLFYAAQGELDTKACVPLERTVKDIDNALLIPLIQGTLFAAWQNSYYFNHNILIPTTQEFLPEGYVLAQSVLPIIANVDSSAAKDIASVMVDDFPNYTREKASNYATVFSAMKRAVSKMDGVDCKQIGSIGGQGFCPGDADPNPSYRLTLSAIVIIPMSGLLWLLF